jgi:SAM-dependent methyltransferase
MSDNGRDVPLFNVPAEWLESVGHCPVCASSDREVAIEGMGDINYGVVAGDWRFQRCLTCHSFYLDPRIDRDHIAKAYATYETHAAGTGRRERKGLARFVQRLADAYTQWRYALPSNCDSLPMAIGAYLLPMLRLERDFTMRHAYTRSSPGSVLDVGCGNGDFLMRMHEAGWHTRGLDFDPQAVAVAQSRGLDVVLAAADSMASDVRHYDLVTASHVIEHIHRPREFLLELFDKVAPGGALWIATPNIESPVRKLMGKYWNSWEVPRHLQMFNVGSLRTFMRESLGDQYCLSVRRRGWHIYWAMAQSEVLREGKRRGARLTLSRSQKLVALALECMALLSPRWGDEIVVEVRKPASAG